MYIIPVVFSALLGLPPLDPCAFAADLAARFPKVARPADLDAPASPLKPDDPPALKHTATIAAAKEALEAALSGGTCVKELSIALDQAATHHHRDAQKYKGTVRQQMAMDYYDLELRLPAPPDGGEKRWFFRAELLWDMERWMEAADGYAATVAANPKGEYARTSAYNRALAIEKLLALSSRQDQTSSGSGRAWEPQPSLSPLSDLEKKLVEACDAYLALFPLAGTDRSRREVAEVNAIAFKAAYILAYHGERQARARLENLINVADQDVRASAAVELLYLMVRLDDPDLANTAAQLAADPVLGRNPRVQGMLAAVRRQKKSPP